MASTPQRPGRRSGAVKRPATRRSRTSAKLVTRPPRASAPIATRLPRGAAVRATPEALTAHGRAVRRAIHAVVRRIPRGRVATYGQVAEMAGFPGGARVAGATMKVSKPADRLPWQRVVGKRGGLGVIAIHDPVGAAVQQRLLEDEGVIVSERGTIALARFGWIPSKR